MAQKDKVSLYSLPQPEYVTIMVLKVDLQCCRCYMKVKKVVSEFPQIRDQTFDEKANTVTIIVVCCNPEKVRDKLRCKGGFSIESIEIKPPPKSPARRASSLPKPPETPVSSPLTAGGAAAATSIVIRAMVIVLSNKTHKPAQSYEVVTWLLRDATSNILLLFFPEEQKSSAPLLCSVSCPTYKCLTGLCSYSFTLTSFPSKARGY
ncbi:uncharacterized protein LOC105770509 isoform X2 [Gossypium raimondii]|uniref:uncharacterized protein LOC105770509 isoform X2 n=1 Tax=Gossypium raimondii TaxID=29730 RepID=UPI00227B7C19|nr:uncharacterized protein LOC105770509 isoform X2 [Gossypium raimondii]XP_052486022.1 uncharacterized protein LOC105770509 isoform X2 [Gossypium raimondii]